MEISVNENKQPNDVPNVNTEQAQPTQAQEVHFDEGVWEDDFVDETIGSFFIDENAPVEEPKQEQAETQPQQEEDPQAEEEQKQEEPTTWEVEIGNDGEKVNLSNEQIQEAVEFRIAYEKNKGNIEKSLQLSKAIQQDQNLQAILKAYSQGQPLPQFGTQQAMQAQPQTQQEQQQFASQNEAMQAFRQQVIQEVAPVIVKQLQEYYQPFVDNVNKFEQSYNTQREFAEIQKDKDYAEVDNLLTMNIKHKLNEGAITVQQAAMLEEKLRTDPKFYKEWFGKFKAAKNAKPAQETKTVTAPKVATNSQVSAPPQSFSDLLGKAIEGEDEAIGALFT